jgi:hypothetical protein
MLSCGRHVGTMFESASTFCRISRSRYGYASKMEITLFNAGKKQAIPGFFPFFNVEVFSSFDVILIIATRILNFEYS